MVVLTEVAAAQPTWAAPVLRLPSVEREGMAANELSIVVTEQELELLKKLNFPCSEKILASARFDERQPG